MSGNRISKVFFQTGESFVNNQEELFNLEDEYSRNNNLELDLYPSDEMDEEIRLNQNDPELDLHSCYENLVDLETENFDHNSDENFSTKLNWSKNKQVICLTEMTPRELNQLFEKYENKAESIKEIPVIYERVYPTMMSLGRRAGFKYRNRALRQFSA